MCKADIFVDREPNLKVHESDEEYQEINRENVAMEVFQQGRQRNEYLDCDYHYEIDVIPFLKHEILLDCDY